MAAAQSKKVKQYSPGGKHVRTFESVKEAAKYIGVNPGSMSAACRGIQKTCRGFIWKYA
jgi:hypothetical protein